MPDTRPHLLFLCHRIPYPPNKGDKIRSYHWWRALIERYRVHLGAFIDDPLDWMHVPRIEGPCASSFFCSLPRRRATLRSLAGLVTGEPLTLPFYRDRRMTRWVSTRLDAYDIRHVLVYSSAMAQYATDARLGGARRVIDFVDVDSDKWRQYGLSKAWPLSWVYRRESERLGRFERETAAGFDSSIFVSAQEVQLFRANFADESQRLDPIPMGVDTEYFDPALLFAPPLPVHRDLVVFTGAMDYWANVDAVTWFVREVWPKVRVLCPDALFAIVGANPGPSVMSLAGSDVVVTGRVADVRPYLAQARVAVAPIRIARGIQSKVLEAMAMARPVVVTGMGLEGIQATPGSEILVADDPQAFAAAVVEAIGGLHPDLAQRARSRVVTEFAWSDSTRRLLDLIEPSGQVEEEVTMAERAFASASRYQGERSW